MKPRVLIIDDEDAVRSSLKMIFEYEGYDTLLAANGPVGLKIAESEAPDLVFLDVRMPQMDGLEVLKRLKEKEPAPPVVILSGHGTVKTAVEAVKLGAFDFIEKPPESERILIAARNALGQKRLVEENRRLRLVFDDRYRMVGESPALEKVWDAVRRAAPTNATVLITGESGVGKELVARAIHRNSLRADEAFVQVNCAAIPEELIESELFGHEKGSFTGATEKQIGKFELAHKGTIFLDEVGDMSLRTQAKVLRVLQEGEVERIGSQKTIQVDVRVIAATNKNLEEEIATRPVPRGPLLPALGDADRRARRCASGPRTSPRSSSTSAASSAPRTTSGRRASRARRSRRSRSHAWRGNVRELKNAVERLLIMVEDDEVRPEHLEDVLRRPTEEAPAAAAAAATLRGLQGRRRARVPGPEAARERLEHLGHGYRHRHAPLEPLQEARGLRHQPGEGRVVLPCSRSRSGPGDRRGGVRAGEESPDSIGQRAG